MTERKEPDHAVRHGKVLIVGQGNIGAPLTDILAPHLSALILVDSDKVDAQNVLNQPAYEPADVGRWKVHVVAERLRRRFPQLEVKVIAADIEDVPMGWFEVPDVVLSAVDNLRARQVLNERAFRLGIPLIDGGVGEPMLGRVQVVLPSEGEACLECPWTERHYRRLALETPCVPGGATNIAPTRSPAAVGAAVASITAAECLKVLAGRTESHGVDITFDLDQRTFSVARVRRAKSCRFDHQIVVQKRPLGVPFASATIADVLAAVRSEGDGVAVEARRGIFPSELFRQDVVIGRDRLKALADRSLSSLGLTPLDRLRVQPGDGSPSWLLSLAP